MEKFVKKLKKDLKKSPGKAAVLALLSVVALWFWAPLVMQLFGKEAEPVVALTPSRSPANSTTNTIAVPAVIQTPTSWKELAAAIDRDPRMKPAARLTLTRDPFRPIEPEQPKEVAAATKHEPQPAPLDVPPSEVGLVLSGTIVGPHQSIARLNGKSYRRGDWVSAPESKVPLTYRIVDVSGRSVTLALGEKQYELKMARRQSSAAADMSGDLPDTVSSDSPDFDPAILEQLN